MASTSKMIARGLGVLGIATADAQTLTGCLTKWAEALTKLVICDDPARPCRGKETQLSLPLEDGGH